MTFIKIRKHKHDKNKKQNQNQNQKMPLLPPERITQYLGDLCLSIPGKKWCPIIHSIFWPDMWTILIGTVFEDVCWGALSVTTSVIRSKEGDKAGETWEGDNEDSDSSL